jgi:hypothetical protein
MAQDPIHREAVSILQAVHTELIEERLSQPAELERALKSVKSALAALDGLPKYRGRLEDTALGYVIGGRLSFALGNTQAGLDLYNAALQQFEEAGGVSENFGIFLHDLAVRLNELVGAEPALQYALRAQKVLAEAGSGLSVDQFIDNLRSGSGAMTIEDYRSRFKKAREGQRAEVAQALAVALLEAGAASGSLGELHDALKVAFDESWNKRASKGFESSIAVLRTMIELYWQGLPLPHWLPEANERALTEIRRSGRADYESDLLAVRAIWLLSKGEQNAGLESALAALARNDEYDLATATALIRLLTGRINEYARQFALHAAIEQRDHKLAAELIESARMQVEPQSAQASPDGPIMWARSRIAHLRPVSAGGRSRLAPLYRSGSDIGAPVAIEDMATAVGGPQAILWAAWLCNDRIYWAVLADGEWSSGEIEFSDGTPLRRLLEETSLTFASNRSADPAQVLRGSWSRNVIAEEMLSAELGQILIPPPLKAIIAKRPENDPPLSLVLSGNLFAFIPAPLLASHVVKGGIRRLLEAAILRVAPPAALTDRVAVRPPSTTSRYPLVLTCVDPTGDLAYSRKIPPGTSAVLSGYVRDGYPLATLDNLKAALREVNPGDPGLFYYSGHAVQTALGGDSEQGLALSGGDTLSAHMLFQDAAGVSFPSRSLLSACASSGAAGAGSGEWLGLTAAILWQGSRQVIGTNWRILDTPFTQEFDQKLAGSLQTAADAAAALRAVQLDALGQWRSSTHDFSDLTEEGLPWSHRYLALPVIWGAYSCVGVQL